ncbi:MAG: hypothetical protein KF894_34135 [Labilithrix sp.]|nr:hypothetical protein [Labilithrix sp.]
MSRYQIVRPREPAGLGWLRLGSLLDPKTGTASFAWIHETALAQVISSVQIADLPRSGTPGPQWHVSVTDRSTPHPRRASPKQIALACCAFDMLAAEEDNHHPGNARHFWLPVDPSERVDCECKTDETVVAEPDGYRWTNPADGPCRGCELEKTMRASGMERPCPIHGAGADATSEGVRGP